MTEDEDEAASSWTVEAIGRVTSTRTEAIDDDWDAVEATITLLPPFEPDALASLADFSHIEVIFLFDRVDPDHGAPGRPRPPQQPGLARGRDLRPAGQEPARTASGLATCELLGVDGVELHVRGLDAIDGTPVLDIKPYMVEFGPRHDVRAAGVVPRADGRVLLTTATIVDQPPADRSIGSTVLRPDIRPGP